MKIFLPFWHMFPQQNSEVTLLGTSVNSSEKLRFLPQQATVLNPLLADQVPGTNQPNNSFIVISSQHWDERYTCSHQASWSS